MAASQLTSRTETNFNHDWSFQLSDIEPKNQGWRSVRLPHDWSVEHDFDEQWEGATGYLPGGMGWYRKTFLSSQIPSGKRGVLLFDGIYNHAEIFINGQLVAKQVFGYSPFFIELNPYLQPKGSNEIVVKVDRSRIADSRWYTGSGIYRDVKLICLNPCHIPLWESFISTPQVSQSSATIRNQLKVELPEGESSLQLELNIRAVGESKVLASGCWDMTHYQSGQKLSLELELKKPKLWSPDAANLYLAETIVYHKGQEVDRLQSRFGVREFHFCPEQGFFLNQQAMKIKGVCLHHDAGAVGVAVPKAVWKRRLLSLKAAGVNAIRMAHNPASDELLDLCDDLGLLVQDEFFDEWDFSKDKRLNMNDQHGDYLSEGYANYFQANAESDLKRALKCHRNHPCVFMWSIGNEIEWTYPRNVEATGFFDVSWDGNYFWSLPPHSREEILEHLATLPEHDKNIGATAQQLAQWVKEEDLTRPVTANCILPSASYESGYADALDVIGFSYRQVVYDYGHKHHPELPIIGNENLPQWHEWKAVIERPHVAGVFLWTAIDYMGEVNKQWPTKALASGLLDCAGFTKSSYYMYQSLWLEQPVLNLTTRILPEEGYDYQAEQYQVEESDSEAWKSKLWIWPDCNEHWNYTDQDIILIEGFSNAEELELLLNGTSLGRRQLIQQDDRICKWAVPYQAGELLAIAYREGQIVQKQALRTADQPYQVLVESPDASDCVKTGDVCHLICQLADEDGIAVKHLQQGLSFTLKGAELLGVDNGSPNNVQAYQASSLVTDRGRALLILRRTGSEQVQVIVNMDSGAETRFSI